jgi:hypothetical protein
VPSSWAGFGSLLAEAGERAPADALALANVVATGDDRADQVDFSGIWALPADLAPVRSRSLVRALDDKGRLQLPVSVDAKCYVAVERDGALVTVFLPGSPDLPRPNYAAAALPLYPGGRLLLSAGTRRQAGIPDRADVLAILDPDRLTVTLTAASRLDAAITEAFDALRRVTGDTDDIAERSTDESALPSRDECESAGPVEGARRLRIVG